MVERLLARCTMPSKATVTTEEQDFIKWGGHCVWSRPWLTYHPPKPTTPPMHFSAAVPVIIICYGWDNAQLQSVILPWRFHVGFLLFLLAYFSSGGRTRASRPTYLIYIFWSCVPAVQTVKERAGTACPNCTAAFGKSFGLLFQRVDGFKDEAQLQLSAALCENHRMRLYGGAWH